MENAPRFFIGIFSICAIFYMIYIFLAALVEFYDEQDRYEKKMIQMHEECDTFWIGDYYNETVETI